MSHINLIKWLFTCIIDYGYYIKYIYSHIHVKSLFSNNCFLVLANAVLKLPFCTLKSATLSETCTMRCTNIDHPRMMCIGYIVQEWDFKLFAVAVQQCRNGFLIEDYLNSLLWSMVARISLKMMAMMLPDLDDWSAVLQVWLIWNKEVKWWK